MNEQKTLKMKPAEAPWWK